MTTTSFIAPSQLDWEIHASCPAHWQESIRLFGGSFFHSSRGLLLSAPAGEPIFCELSENGEPIGIATGVRHGCAMHATPCHVYFPTVPAMVHGPRREAALTRLLDLLAEQGAVDVVVDSFDARWIPGSTRAAEALTRRREYVLPLFEPTAIFDKLGSKYRDLIQKSKARALTFRAIDPAEASALLAAARGGSAHEARLIEAYSTYSPALAPSAHIGLRSWCGIGAFAALEENRPLAVALLGWANGRAYHLAGGNLSHDGDADALVWFHTQIIEALIANGYTTYNLGTTSATAVNPLNAENPAHRLRMGFVPQVSDVYGARWRLRGEARFTRPSGELTVGSCAS